MWIDNGNMVCGNSECDWETTFAQFFQPAPSPPFDLLEQTRKALEDANSLCRSAKSIADRKGEKTNWEAFNQQLDESLERQHRVMYPDNDK